MITVDTVVNERGTIGFVMSFTDENKEPVTPKSILWTLTDDEGTVINNRENVALIPSNPATVVLTDEDVALVDNLSTTRFFTMNAIYDSSNADNLRLVEEAKFVIGNMVAIDVTLGTLYTYYWGISETDDLDAAGIIANIQSYITPHQTNTAVFEPDGTPNYLYFALPTALGVLSSITLNGVDQIAAFETYSASLSGVACTVYKTIDLVSVDGTYLFNR